MTAKLACSLFVVFAIAVGMAAGPAFADHSEVTIIPVDGSGVAGCEVEEDGCFIPTNAVVDVGGKVIFSNTDVAIHTFVSGVVGEPDGTFDSGLVNPNAAFEWEPDTVGEYSYICSVHPWMVGMITVQEAGEPHEEEGDSMSNPNESETPDPNDEDGEPIGALKEDENMDGDGMKMEDGEMMEGEGKTDGMMMEDGMMEGGELMVEIDVHGENSGAGDIIPIAVKITTMGKDGESAIEHGNYHIVAMQMGETILDIEQHTHTGVENHDSAPLLAAVSDDAPVDVTVTFNGFGLPTVEERTGPIGMITEKQEVPEFGVIAVMVLAVAVISVVAISARSRLTLSV